MRQIDLAGVVRPCPDRRIETVACYVIGQHLAVGGAESDNSGRAPCVALLAE